MKKNKMFIIVALCMMVMPVFAATSSSGIDITALCPLIQEFQGIFQLLRTLAFVGAGMIVAKYAWEAISTGKIGGETDLTAAAKKVGIPMIVGFILLFGIGVLLHIMSGVTGAKLFGCDELFQNW